MYNKFTFNVRRKKTEKGNIRKEKPQLKIICIFGNILIEHFVNSNLCTCGPPSQECKILKDNKYVLLSFVPVIMPCT